MVPQRRLHMPEPLLCKSMTFCSSGKSVTFWIAFGSWAIGRVITHKIKEKIVVFTLCEIILAFLLPISVICVRFIPFAFKFSPGEIIGILPMSIATFVLLAPICILGGFLFVLGCDIYKVTKEGAVQIGHVYILEAIGASIGGLLTSLFLIRYFSPLYIMFFVGLLNLIAASLLLWKRKILSIVIKNSSTGEYPGMLTRP